MSALLKTGMSSGNGNDNGDIVWFVAAIAIISLLALRYITLLNVVAQMSLAISSMFANNVIV